MWSHDRVTCSCHVWDFRNNDIISRLRKRSTVNNKDAKFPMGSALKNKTKNSERHILVIRTNSSRIRADIRRE